MTGVPASPSGCQPTASAADASSRSGIPNADPRKVIEVAVAIAEALGDDFDAAPYNKAEWIDTRGGEPFRDVNMPFQCDYLSAATVAIKLAKAVMR